MPHYWEPVEAEWQSQFVDELRPLLEVVADAHDFVAFIAKHEDLKVMEPRETRLVLQLLLRRIGEELRAVELMAANGHGYQAVSAATNVFEQAQVLMNMSANDEKAAQFLTWTDPHESMDSVRRTVKKTGEIIGWDKDRTDDEYKTYGFLCGFKHNNPMFQRFLRLPGDPDVFLGKFALANAMWFVLSAVGLVTVLRLQPKNSVDAIEKCNGLMDRARELNPTIPAGLEAAPAP